LRIGVNRNYGDYIYKIKVLSICDYAVVSGIERCGC